MFDWTPNQIFKLELLWAEGLSTAEIGRRLNISKNAVVGKAKRLKLPARPSPIVRGGEKADKPVITRLPTNYVQPLAKISRKDFKNKPCCWPIGQPKDKDFRFCNEITLPGKPYCAEHDKLAYAASKEQYRL